MEPIKKFDFKTIWKFINTQIHYMNFNSVSFYSRKLNLKFPLLYFLKIRESQNWETICKLRIWKHLIHHTRFAQHMGTSHSEIYYSEGNFSISIFQLSYNTLESIFVIWIPLLQNLIETWICSLKNAKV